MSRSGAAKGMALVMTVRSSSASCWWPVLAAPGGWTDWSGSRGHRVGGGG